MLQAFLPVFTATISCAQSQLARHDLALWEQEVILQSNRRRWQFPSVFPCSLCVACHSGETKNDVPVTETQHHRYHFEFKKELSAESRCLKMFKEKHIKNGFKSK